ncbi:maleylpyruvate isomerase N-terminal domain-containing protein [Panacibacter sp. DH6]|uniref:Maleylpyruvate isomerase N-terminal domain-containing protein n=1 Tax=Panacibacter microcysteis TaxID=2793269 RepID=A0A931DYU1_9BACT|nr:maleylpyruvate isomerase N-terminal domain-containing protein [Panacibacter microcysteis]MBG9375442.1 maleylpyruvate isomerase N-terminal domain-containing protein [Panacibacter microcysteis]
MQTQPAPIQVQHLFEPLDDSLMELLYALTPADWEKSTVARLWKVKDVAAHLLDGNIRTLSLQKDRYFGETPPAINTYNELVDWLNKLNADWVAAAKRMSPAVLILLHEATRKETSAYYKSLNLYDKAVFAVSWAGEEESLNWLHIAREYTEKWLHQQQIRDAVHKPGIMTSTFFYPFMDTCMYALPYTYKNIDAATGTTIELHIEGDGGGSWLLTKTGSGWLLSKEYERNVTARISLPAAIAWKLFSKSMRPADITNSIHVTGDETLALHALNMISVMA